MIFNLHPHFIILDTSQAISPPKTPPYQALLLLHAACGILVTACRSDASASLPRMKRSTGKGPEWQ